MIDLLSSRLPGIPFQRNITLDEHTSFGIGGPARVFTEIDDEIKFSKIIKATSDLNIDTLILGGGTNLLVSDDGFEGLAVKLEFKEVQVDEDNLLVRAGAGVATSNLVETLIDRGLQGLEFASGLPGTVGGAIAGNAGCFGNALSDFLVGATVIKPDGTINEITDKGWFDFDYRHSTLSQTGAVISSALFRLAKGDKKALQEKADEYLAVRADKHPHKGMKTAGSYFKNLPPLTPGERRRAAGALLDKAGAHGLEIGDASVFERHANIIINRGCAKAADVLGLASKMAELVKTHFGVTLEPEVRFIGKRHEQV